MRRLLVPVCALLALLTPSCSSDSTKTTACGGQKAHPAFLVTFQASDGEPLPSTTRVTVRAGGGTETFDASLPPSVCSSMIFCRVILADDAGAPDGGDTPSDAGCHVTGDAGVGSPTVAAIACSLWTDGAADVMVDAPGFLPLDRALKAKTDECGIVTDTSTVTVTRLPLDGGN
jgi:hypothetical protein